MALKRSKPVYFDHPLSNKRRLIASWQSYARYLKNELPEAWEIMPRAELSPLEAQCKESGSQWFSPGYKRRQDIYQQIRISQMSPEQAARHQARQAENQAHKRREGRLRRFTLLEPHNPFYGLTLDQTKARYRQLAKEYHPDAGGKVQAFIKLKADYDNALYHATVAP